METNIEKRYAVELRATGDSRTISGTAIVFNTESQLLGGMFTEIIKPEAVSADLLSKSDILLLFNHEDDDIPLARSKYGKGSLKIAITANGVDFSFDARKTPQGDEILSAVRSGDVDSCSFAFCVADDGDEWFSKPDGTYLRTITKFEEIRDFSLVNSPAYTEATCRSLDKFKETRTEEIPPVVAPEVEVIPEVIPEAVVEPETVIVSEVIPEVVADEIAEFYAPLDEIISKLSEA